VNKEKDSIIQFIISDIMMNMIGNLTKKLKLKRNTIIISHLPLQMYTSLDITLSDISSFWRFLFS